MAGFFIMRKIVAIFFILVTNCLLSQNNRVEKAILFFKGQPDIKIAEAFNDSSFEIKFVNPEIAVQFARTALVHSEKSKNDTVIASSFLYLGTAFHVMSAYDSAMVYYMKAEQKFVRLKDDKRMGTIYLHLASLFSDAKDNVNAKAYSYKSMSYFVRAKDTNNLAAIYSNLGIYYDYDNKTDSTLYYYFKALDLRKKYTKIKPERRALNLSVSYTNIGHLYQHKLRDLQKAIYYFNLAFEEDEKHPDVLYKIATYENLASCFNDMKQYDRSINAGLNGLRLANLIGNYQGRNRLFKTLSSDYYFLKKYDSAYYYMNEYAIFVDSTYALESQKVISEMQQKYESNKKSTEIALLNKDKQNSETFRKTLYVIIGLILIVVLALIYSYVLKQRSNKSLVLKNEEINKQKHLIEEKQKEIIDSIRYAKRIQQSLMPTEKYVLKKIGELKK